MKQRLIPFLTAAVLLLCAACGGGAASARPQETSGTPAAGTAEPSREDPSPAQPEASLPSPAEPEAREGAESLREPPGTETAPGEADGENQDGSPDPPEAASDPVDIDLTPLSATLAFAQIYHMTEAPDEYVGKRLRMEGIFTVYQDPQTQQVYCGVVVQDAAACCAQGFDIVMPPQSCYPDDYPSPQAEVVAVGTIEADCTLAEYGIVALRLADVTFTSVSPAS